MEHSPDFSKVPLRGRIKVIIYPTLPDPPAWILPRFVLKKQLKKSAVMTLSMISPTAHDHD
jgi:hypothetical protein